MHRSNFLANVPVSGEFEDGSILVAALPSVFTQGFSAKISIRDLSLKRPLWEEYAVDVHNVLSQYVIPDDDGEPILAAEPSIRYTTTGTEANPIGVPKSNHPEGDFLELIVPLVWPNVNIRREATVEEIWAANTLTTLLHEVGSSHVDGPFSIPDHLRHVEPGSVEAKIMERGITPEVAGLAAQLLEAGGDDAFDGTYGLLWAVQYVQRLLEE